jgi:hypothetical protein
MVTLVDNHPLTLTLSRERRGDRLRARAGTMLTSPPRGEVGAQRRVRGTVTVEGHAHA